MSTKNKTGTDINNVYKHIRFVTHDDPSNPVRFIRWNCINKKTGASLAEVEYYSRWKKHVVIFCPVAVFDETCLADIQDFLKQLN